MSNFHTVGASSLAGFDYHLVKPVDVGQVQQILAEARRDESRG